MSYLSSTLSLKYSNKNRLDGLDTVLDEYKICLQKYINILWEEKYIPKLIGNDILKQVDSWFSARMLQCCSKQAVGIVNSVRKKQSKLQFRIEKLNEVGKHKQARKIQLKLNKLQTKPIVKKFQMELDNRFLTIDHSKSTSFDIWIKLTSLGNKMKLLFPIKKSKHFNKLNSDGKITNGIRIGAEGVTFMFEMDDIAIKTGGNVLGIDIGQKTLLSCSNGYTSTTNKHGYDLMKITDILVRRKKGSNGFRKAQEHRKNYINWSVNQLNLSEYKQINLEKITNLRYKKNSSRKLSHWNYTIIFDKIKGVASKNGVRILEMNPAYTSQRCSCCGWVKKGNRNGKKFKCLSCSYENDSDLNASINLSLELKELNPKFILQKRNRTGFYWKEVNKEPIVPYTQQIK